MFKKIVTLTLAAALSLGAFVAFGANAQAAKTFVVKEVVSKEPIAKEDATWDKQFKPVYGEELFTVNFSTDTAKVGSVITITPAEKYKKSGNVNITVNSNEVAFNGETASYTLEGDPNDEYAYYSGASLSFNGVYYIWEDDMLIGEDKDGEHYLIDPTDVTPSATPAPAAPVVTPAPAAPAAPATSTVPAIGQTYTVKKGDSLFKIAKKAYNDGNLYIHIYNANKNIIKKPSLIKPGQVLTIPTI